MEPGLADSGDKPPPRDNRQRYKMSKHTGERSAPGQIRLKP